MEREFNSKTGTLVTENFNFLFQKNKIYSGYIKKLETIEKYNSRIAELKQQRIVSTP